MKKLIIFFLVFLFSCEKEELIVEPQLIGFGYCPSDIPTHKVIKFDVLDNKTVDYYVVEVNRVFSDTPERVIKLESKKLDGVQRYECEIEMKSSMYAARIQVVYNKKTSKFFDKTLFMSR